MKRFEFVVKINVSKYSSSYVDVSVYAPGIRAAVKQLKLDYPNLSSYVCVDVL